MNNDLNTTPVAGNAPWLPEGFDPTAPILSCVNLNKIGRASCRERVCLSV